MAKVLRHILAVLCLLAAVFFLLPLGIGILHFGMVWPAALLLLCAACSHGRTSSAACCGQNGFARWRAV